MNIKSFNDWCNSIKESEINSAEPRISEPTVSSNSDNSQKSEIISNVDNIINSLETLALELTEELSEIEDEVHIDEDAGDFIKDWIKSIKAAKSQKKVNKIKMNVADLRFAADKASGDKKKSLEDKATKAKEQSIELQRMVDDKFDGKGTLTTSRLSKEKIKGQMEIIKRTTGMEDDPNKAADLKTKMQELQRKAQEEDAAISKLEDQNSDAIEAEKERLKKEAEDKKNKESKDEPKDEEPKDKNSKEGMIDRYKELLKKAEESGDEDKKKKLQDKIDQLSQKESWQINGTSLGRMFESELVKFELMESLNESKYQINSVKDAFKFLM